MPKATGSAAHTKNDQNDAALAVTAVVADRLFALHAGQEYFSKGPLQSGQCKATANSLGRVNSWWNSTNVFIGGQNTLPNRNSPF